MADHPAPPPAWQADLAPLSWLIGTWVGVGVGTYPGTEDFRFGQELHISSDGRPFLIHSSRSWILDDAGERVRAAACETGFWRPRPDNTVEVLLTHPTGYVETYLGDIEVTGLVNDRITGARAELRTDVVVRTPSAKDYSAGHRLYGLIDGDLGWAFDMAAMGHGITNHLSARLAKVS